MPGCVLRVHGRDLVSDETLSGLSLSACKIWRRGERRLPGSKMNRDVHETSGFSIVVSEQEYLRAQVRDATRFLGDHRDELLTLGRQPAIEGMVLDFGCFVSVAASSWRRSTPTPTAADLARPWPMA